MIYAYINDEYNITEVKSFFGASPSLPELRNGSLTGDVRIPIIVKEIPKMSVANNLGEQTANLNEKNVNLAKNLVKFQAQPRRALASRVLALRKGND